MKNTNMDIWVVGASNYRPAKFGSCKIWKCSNFFPKNLEI